ncbi:hypothetical protein [Actinophytocola sp.]|uniref:hypothetical protein n=1 Tax=Actinophytocola sp. TaxID=1872138 RepID=UPI003D6AC73F
MESEDARLAGALIVLREGLAPAVDQLLFGLLDNEDRRRLARSSRNVAEVLAPVSHDEPTPHAPGPPRAG